MVSSLKRLNNKDERAKMTVSSLKSGPNEDETSLAHNQQLLARSDDINHVAGREELVHELVVTQQREDSLVLAGQQVFLDTYVPRAGYVLF